MKRTLDLVRGALFFAVWVAGSCAIIAWYQVKGEKK